MRNYLILCGVFFISLFPSYIHAGQATNKLGTCLTDSLTGKERVNMVKWLLFSISVHPEISSYLNISEKTKDDSNQFFGNLTTRLLTEDCLQQAKVALKEDGNMAIESAFTVVGEAAMEELMTNQDVAVSLNTFEKYLNKKKLKALNE